MRLNTSLPLAAFLLTLLALGGCGQQAKGQPAAAEPEVTVLTMAPRAVTLTTELPGRTSAHLVSEVRPQVGGIVQKRLFVEGSEVKVGQLLYQIDPATYQAAYDNARAALAKAEANALPAKLKGERFAGLSKVRAVSQQDNDDAQAAHKQSEAEVVSARAALDAARINLSYTRVTAPISGRIGKSSVTQGALVTASQATPLATIQQIDPIYVDVTQSSAEAMRLRRELQSGTLRKAADGGAKASLLLEDGSSYALSGTLQFTDITVDQSTGEVTLRAVFPNPKRELLPGLYVRAVLTEGVNEAALLVPQVAVSRDAKGNPQVLVVKPDGLVENRPIAVSRVLGDCWLVASGLAAGERVVVDGLQKARPGSKVKAVEAAQKPADQADTQAIAQGDAQGNATAPGTAGKPETQASAQKVDPSADQSANQSADQKAAQKAAQKGQPKAEAGSGPEAKAERAAKKSSKAQGDGLPRPKKGQGLVYSPAKDGEVAPVQANPASQPGPAAQ